jgi:hypothetical protein
MVAAAVVGGAVIGAAGSAYAGSQAAGATRDASRSATNAQYAALDQQKQLAAPYTGLGQSAIPTYQALLGIGPKGQAGIQSTLQNLPGYQFAKSQGIDATKAAASSMGLGLSGNTLQGIDQFTTGLADQTYGAELERLLQPIQIGQGAAAGQAANIGAGASNLGNIAIGQGNNLAGIYANETAGITRAIGNAGNQYMTNQTLQNLNNPNYGAPGGWSTGGQTGDLNYGQQVAAGF